MHRLKQIAPGVLVATGELYVTTSTVVTGRDGGCLVIDPAVTVAEVAQLAADLEAAGLRPAAGFASHAHWDHVLWCRQLGDPPRYASAQTVRTAQRELTELITAAEATAPGHERELVGQLVPLEPGAQSLPWDGPQAIVLTHDAHEPGHSALFFPDTGVLVAGDMCSDIEMPLLSLRQADPIGDYRAALRLLGELPVRLVVPGHGTIGDAAEFRRRIGADLAYLDALAAGGEPSDPRMTRGWLFAERDLQVKWVREHSGGAGDDGQ